MQKRIIIITTFLILAGIPVSCDKQICAIQCGENGKLLINVENQTGYTLEKFTLAERVYGTLDSASSTCFMAFDSFIIDDFGPVEYCSAEVNGRKLTEEPLLYIDCFTNQREVKKGHFNFVVSISRLQGQEYLTLSNK